MRFSLHVDDDAGTPTQTQAGGVEPTSPAGRGSDLDAGPAVGAGGGTPAEAGSDARAGASADAGHTSVSSPGAAGAGAGAGAREEEQPPDDGGDGQAGGTAGGLEDVEGYHRPDTESVAEAVVEADDKLPDIGEASFGPAPEAVIGVDDRVQITTTSVYPWRVHASLRITANDGSQWIGTGWFIGPRTLITAGHCVFIRNSGVPNRDGWVRSITVIPGRNGTQQPFGSAVSTNFRTVTGWSNSGNQEYDYGAIILNTNLGSTTGWLGFGAYSDATLLASIANISGYPGDKPAGTQWYHARKVTSVAPRKVYYDVDTYGGQSGSAVYRIVDGKRSAIAVHAYGGGTANSGTRITSGVYDNLVAWKA